MAKEAPKIQSDVAGHRDRLRERFLRSGLTGLNDYEIIELLLTFGTPRRDTKPAAKEALRKFGTVRGVLEAPVEELRKIHGIGKVNPVAIKFIHEIASKSLEYKIVGPKVSVKSSQEVFNHLYHDLSGLKKEVFKVLFLNSQNAVLADEDLFHGTVNSSAVSPREIIEKALEHNAVSLIFVHNHPSGGTDPSQSDKDLTRDLIFAAGTVGIKVLDHLIIGNDRYFSFAGAGLIDQYVVGLENMKRKGSFTETQQKGAGLTDTGLPWEK